MRHEFEKEASVMTTDELPSADNAASACWVDIANASFDQDIELARELALRFNGEPGLTTEQRVDLLRPLFGFIGKGVTLSLGLQFGFGYNIFIGDRTFVNFNAVFLDDAPIVLGRDVWVGPNVTFATPLHPLLAEERRTIIDDDGIAHQYERHEPITVGDDVWIASNATINPGVTIGDGAVIGSGSVVTKDIAPNTLAYGNPCRPIREITEADRVGLRR